MKRSLLVFFLFLVLLFLVMTAVFVIRHIRQQHQVQRKRSKRIRELKGRIKTSEWHIRPGPVQQSTRRTARGVDLALYFWESDTVPITGAVLLIHGMASYTYFKWLSHSPKHQVKKRGLQYQGSIVEALNKRGFRVYAMDMDDHGLTVSSVPRSPNKEPVMAIHTLIEEDVPWMIAKIRTDNGWTDNSRIFFMGHSTGSLILTRVAQEEERQEHRPVAGIISLSPLYGIHVPVVIASSVLYCLRVFLPTHFILSKEGDVHSKVPVHELPGAIVHKIVSPKDMVDVDVYLDQMLDPYFHDKNPVTLGTAFQIMVEMKRLYKNVNHVRSPLLVFHSPFDPVVCFRSTERFFHQCPSKHKKLVDPGFFLLHNILLESGGDTSFRQILEWIESSNSAR